MHSLLGTGTHSRSGEHGMGSLKEALASARFGDGAGVVRQLEEQAARLRARLSSVRRKVLVLSGKGGVGKSVVTAHLALACARRGLAVGVLDADLNGPCIPRILGIEDRRFAFRPEGVVPPVGPGGIRVSSMGLLLNSDEPVLWKGSTAASPVWLGTLEKSVLREMFADVVWGNLDLLLIDLPPGAAADKPPALADLLPDLDGAVVVTTASPVAMPVVTRSVQYARGLGIRILGLVENMAELCCGRCGSRTPLFPGDTTALSAWLDVPMLGRVPFDPELESHGARSSDRVFHPIAAAVLGRLESPVAGRGVEGSQ